MTLPETATTTFTSTLYPMYPQMSSSEINVPNLQQPMTPNPIGIQPVLSGTSKILMTMFKNDYYKPPNSTELVPGDTCGLRTTYDSHHVRTFKAIEAQYTKKQKDLSVDELTKDGKLSECTSRTCSTTISVIEDSVQNCKCHCHKKSRSMKNEALRETKRNIKSGQIKEVHIHYHCPDRHHETRHRSDDWNGSSSSAANDTGYKTDYLYRASSPRRRGRENANKQKDRLQFRLRGVPSPSRRCDTVNGEHGSGFDTWPKGSGNVKSKSHTRHPYNQFRNQTLGIRRDSDSFGIADLPRCKN